MKITVDIPAGTLADLKAEADALHISLETMVHFAVDRYLSGPTCRRKK